MRKLIIISLVATGFLLVNLPLKADELNNQAAMENIDEIKVLYDIRKQDPKLLLAYLRAIESNLTNLKLEKVKATPRIIFIADAVKYLTTNPDEDILFEHADLLTSIESQIKQLKSLGVEMEVCAGATAAYGIDNATIYPELKVVRSGFLSVMGWQQQGYQLVPVYN